MTLHRSARTFRRSRRLLADRVLDQGWSLQAAAEAAGVSERTAWKWFDRFRREGEDGLRDLHQSLQWFRELTDKALRLGVFHSVPDLTSAIEAFLAAHNQDPKPFV